MLFLNEADLAGARATLRAAPVEPTILVAHMATYQDLVWVLDDEQRGASVAADPEGVR